LRDHVVAQGIGVQAVTGQQIAVRQVIAGRSPRTIQVGQTNSMLRRNLAHDAIYGIELRLMPAGGAARGVLIHENGDLARLFDRSHRAFDRTPIAHIRDAVVGVAVTLVQDHDVSVRSGQ
jgi:hypothetical protein